MYQISAEPTDYGLINSQCVQIVEISDVTKQRVLADENVKSSQVQNSVIIIIESSFRFNFFLCLQKVLINDASIFLLRLTAHRVSAAV